MREHRPWAYNTCDSGSVRRSIRCGTSDAASGSWDKLLCLISHCAPLQPHSYLLRLVRDNSMVNQVLPLSSSAWLFSSLRGWACPFSSAWWKSILYVHERMTTLGKTIKWPAFSFYGLEVSFRHSLPNYWELAFSVDPCRQKGLQADIGPAWHSIAVTYLFMYCFCFQEPQEEPNSLVLFPETMSKGCDSPHS